MFIYVFETTLHTAMNSTKSQQNPIAFVGIFRNMTTLI